jgi:hypothetical protein
MENNYEAGKWKFRPDFSKTSIKEFFSSFLSDISSWVLIASNILVIFFAISEDWNFGTIIWSYWLQGIIIGIFSFIKILTLKNFTTYNLTKKNNPVEASKATRVSVASFFLFHYGFFHLVYAIFLIFFTFIGPLKAEINYIALAGIIFAINHLFSYFYNRERDSEKIQSLGKLMFSPYVRIFPIHVTIIFVGFILNFAHFNTIVLIFFLGLKAIIDVFAHLQEHFLSKA